MMLACWLEIGPLQSDPKIEKQCQIILALYAASIDHSFSGAIMPTQCGKHTKIFEKSNLYISLSVA